MSAEQAGDLSVAWFVGFMALATLGVYCLALSRLPKDGAKGDGPWWLPSLILLGFIFLAGLSAFFLEHGLRP